MNPVPSVILRFFASNSGSVALFFAFPAIGLYWVNKDDNYHLDVEEKKKRLEAIKRKWNIDTNRPQQESQFKIDDREKE